MNDQQKSKDELIHEVQALRQRVSDLSAMLQGLPVWDEAEERVMRIHGGGDILGAEAASAPQGQQPVELLMDHLPILIAYIDEDQRYLYVNRAYAAWYGKEKSYFIRQKIAHILPPDAYVNVLPNIQRVMSGETFSFENISYTSEGEERTVLATYVPYIDANSEVHSFIGMVQDITARKRAAAERERMFAAERAQRELAETFIEITNALNTIHEREQVLQTILAQLARVIPYDSASVMLISDDQFQIVAEKGLPTDYKDLHLALANTKLPQIQDVLRKRHPVIIQDTQTDPRWYANPEITHIRCWMGTPLIVRYQVIGLLSLEKQEPNFYAQRHAELSAAFANQAAIAIENARLYEQARRDARTKSMLLEEVNHRVGNNLTAILGLLLAERRYAQQNQQRGVEATLKRLARRIEGLAEAHRLLSHADQHPSGRTPILLSYLVTRIIELAINTLPATQKISLDVEMTKIEIAPSQATPLALILNELATNTVKYTMRGRQRGKITLTIEVQEVQDEGKNDGGIIKIVYRDDGPGYPPKILEEQQYHIGLYLVQRLVQGSLQGQLTLANQEGAVTTLRFPAKRPTDSLPWPKAGEGAGKGGI